MAEDQVKPRFEGSQLIIEAGSESEIYDSRYLVAALLVSVAKSDGNISQYETGKMLQLVGEHFHLKSSESLELLNRAMTNFAEDPDLTTLLGELGSGLTTEDKEDIAVMLLKVVAADGRRDAEEMDTLSQAAEVIDISRDSMHRAFDRYFDDKPA